MDTKSTLKIVVCISTIYIYGTTLFAQTPLIVTTTTMLTDITRQLVGSHCQVVGILETGTDPHTYEATPDDAALLSRADVIIRNGLHLEGWLDKVIANSKKPSTPVLTVTDGLVPLVSEQHADAPDPHAWMNPILVRDYFVPNIANLLSARYPAHTPDFRHAADEYTHQLSDLHHWIVEQIKLIAPEHRIIITTHDAFSYFAKAYGMTVKAAMGVSTDADIQTSDYQALAETIRRYRVPAIFVETTLNPKQLQQLAYDNNVRIGGFLYADSLGDETSPASTYIGMIRTNVLTLVHGLQPTPTAAASEASPISLGFLLLIAAVMLISIAVFYRRLHTF